MACASSSPAWRERSGRACWRFKRTVGSPTTSICSSAARPASWPHLARAGRGRRGGAVLGRAGRGGVGWREVLDRWILSALGTALIRAASQAAWRARNATSGGTQSVTTTYWFAVLRSPSSSTAVRDTRYSPGESQVYVMSAPVKWNTALASWTAQRKSAIPAPGVCESSGSKDSLPSRSTAEPVVAVQTGAITGTGLFGGVMVKVTIRPNRNEPMFGRFHVGDATPPASKLAPPPNE